MGWGRVEGGGWGEGAEGGGGGGRGEESVQEEMGLADDPVGFFEGEGADLGEGEVGFELRLMGGVLEID